MRRLLIMLFGSILLSNIYAEPLMSIKEGVDYTIINIDVKKTPEPLGKVNVKEFFSFVCVHCKDLEPIMEKTLQMNKNIDLNKIQVVWDEGSAKFGRLNATLQELKLYRLYFPMFTAIFDRQDLTNVEVLRKFLLKNGLGKEKADNFIDIYQSFAINVKSNEYKELTKKYNINATPVFIVGDRYSVIPAQPEKMVRVVQALVKQYPQLVKGKK